MSDTETTAVPDASAPVLVGVTFETAGSVQFYDPGPLDLKIGETVVVPAERGSRLGRVVSGPRPAAPQERSRPPLRVVRRAETADADRDDRLRVRQRDALRVCAQRIAERAMPIKLLGGEASPDAGRFIFYFAAEGRVDFRELVRDVAHLLHARVEMRQVGAREEAKLAGAAGPCGRELCCASWLREPGGVSLKMAKAQGLALNPSRLAGMCGRLKCCLRYEYNTYVELGRNLPRTGTTVESVHGAGVVVRHTLLKQSVVIRLADGAEAEASLDDLVDKRAR